MAARLLAIVIVISAGAQGYRQALANASKSGAAQEAMQNMRRVSKIMAEPEARQIIGVTEHSTWEEILQDPHTFAHRYRQALANASKSGAAQEAMQNVRRVCKIMAEPEARQILGVTEHSTWEEILQKYDSLFEQNAKNGSFYLQSKLHRAKECLEAIYQKEAPKA